MQLEGIKMKSRKDRGVESTGINVAPKAALSLRLGVKTFGTRHFLDVTTLNVSTSGMLVHVDDPKAAAPFQNKTLLELVFYPDGNIFHEEVYMTGVVVRSIADAADQSKKREFGVRVVDVPDVFERVVDQALKGL
jgi:hypothetical protein